MARGVSVVLPFLVMFVSGYGQEWVARYQGPYGEDYARAIAVDDLKNVYVTGGSQGPGAGYVNDYATVKYDSLGVVQWVARYNGSPTENWPDEAAAIAVDENGIYVTGYIRQYIVDDSSDYCTVKYDKATGDTLWLRRYDGPANDCDEACAITLDDAGNVYVTGKSRGVGTGSDFATVKYSPDGVEQWAARYNNPGGNSTDMAYALAVDGSGNVYVTGESYDLTTFYDCVTVKYDSLGVEQWVRRYSCQDDYTDEGNAIALDGAGNVYVTGRSVGNSTSWDYATIKYNPSGVRQWVSRYHGMENYGDEPSGIAVDDSGNVYVTGGSGIGGLFLTQFATVKYAPDGTQEWVKTYIGPAGISARARAIAVDSQNNVCVTGYDGDFDTTLDYVTIEYTPSGGEEWVARYSVPGGDHRAYAIAVDQDDYVYVTGASESVSGDPDYLTVKYPPSGTGVQERPASELPMLRAYPNPFLERTEIAWDFSLDSSRRVCLRVFDVNGCLVRQLEPFGRTFWDGTDDSGDKVLPGIYFIQVQSAEGLQAIKAILTE